MLKQRNIRPQFDILCKERVYLFSTWQFIGNLFSVGKIRLHISKQNVQPLKFSKEAQNAETCHYSFRYILKVHLECNWPSLQEQRLPLELNHAVNSLCGSIYMEEFVDTDLKCLSASLTSTLCFKQKIPVTSKNKTDFLGVTIWSLKSGRKETPITRLFTGRF